ncbi:FkbM family methyltransferase [Kordiimonas aestuarii]|uniref:FkbM family methyltransferase n=1 Tax=Kordiimonas aestuarii TaxID=1005925 RepID=UPI0021D3A6F7|nr:FkbM family methyltransferase [Kordiimonas aestuarii]
MVWIPPPPLHTALGLFETYDLLAARAAEEGKHIGPLYEDIVLGLYAAILKPGDIAVDVGAHDGHHTFPMSSIVGPQGHVFAVEAIDVVYMTLLQYAARHGRYNITAMNIAASDKAGEATFTYYRKIPGYSGLLPAKLPHTDEELGTSTMTVQCAPLDLVIPRERRVRFIKLDIEGGEFHALKGARELISQHRPVMAFENGLERAAAQYGYSADDFFSLFDEIDYVPHFISGHKLTPEYWARANRPHFFELVALPRELAGLAAWVHYIALKRAAGPFTLDDWREAIQLDAAPQTMSRP